ncbi:hypothetical protein OEA41_009546 [Lepraria neglecta]|uniref:Uncharacterized protein n=1 Tax=Lepraria neglecta TaxID=209136 RepID=A0AAD9Z2H9_9LECA|nr:hypothetical protein OEA41_009546 [Lepraria neglecta]
MATKKACNALQTTFPVFATDELCTRLNLDCEIMSQIRPELQIKILTEVTKNPQRFAHLDNEARIVACLDSIVDGIRHDIDLMKELIASLPKEAQMVLDASVRFRSSGGTRVANPETVQWLAQLTGGITLSPLDRNPNWQLERGI